MSEKGTKAEKTEFTIEEAAEYLGKSVRTIERRKLPHTLQTRRGADYIDRQVRIFSKSVLDEAMQPKVKEVIHVPGLAMTLERQDNDAIMTKQNLVDFAEFIANSLKSSFDAQTKLLAPMADVEKKKFDLEQISIKLLLTKKEALQLSGLTEQELDRALQEKAIRGAKTSKNGVWKINRKSLESYIDNNF